MLFSQKHSKKYEIDMCSGPLFSKIIAFSIPLLLSGVLQILFNAADVMIVGRFSGSKSLAAVGATSSLISLFINLFIGISIGVDVIASYHQTFCQTRLAALERVLPTPLWQSCETGQIPEG